jgi:xanthine permease XanP
MKKPVDLAYGVDERPPPLVTWLTALQHVAVFPIVMIFPLLVSRAAGAPAATAVSMMSLGMLVLGVATIVQALPRGPVGSGYFAPTAFHPSYLGPSLVAAKLGGLPLVFGMTIFAGALEAGLSRLWERLRPYFPPEMSGLVVMLVGIVLATVGLRSLFTTDAGAPSGPREWATAATTLGVMVLLNVWTKGALRIFCTLIGTIAGYTLAVALGLVSMEAFAEVWALPLVAPPRLDHISWDFDAALMLPFAVAGVAAMMSTSANITILQRLNDAEWVRPDVGSIKRGALADGLAASIGGIAGSFGMSTLAMSVGVIVATGVASRTIAYAAGALAFVLAFLPKVTALMVAIPSAVVAGALVFLACFVLVSGMQIITSRMLDGRKTLVIGLSIAAAIAVLMFPEAAENAPGWIRPLLGSPLVTGTLLGLGLNLLFRLGVRRRVSLAVEPGGDYAKAIEEFFLRQGAAWGARPDVIRRAIFGATQLVETVIDNCEPTGALALDASFDEFNLDIRMSYDGSLLELPPERPSEREIRESEDGVRRLAGFMLRRNADRAQSVLREGRALIHFHFDH